MPQAIRVALSENLKIFNNDHIALAGVFRVLNGKIRSHVQPDYKDIKHEYYDPKLMKCTKDFLQFYEPVGPKLQCYTVLWTGDPMGGELNLRESGEHTHFHSYEHKNDAGHYHFDVTPDERTELSLTTTQPTDGLSLVFPRLILAKLYDNFIKLGTSSSIISLAFCLSSQLNVFLLIISLLNSFISFLSSFA